MGWGKFRVVIQGIISRIFKNCIKVFMNVGLDLAVWWENFLGTVFESRSRLSRFYAVHFWQACWKEKRLPHYHCIYFIKNYITLWYATTYTLYFLPSRITREWLKFGLTKSTKNSSTLVSRWPASLIWVTLPNSSKWRRGSIARALHGSWKRWPMMYWTNIPSFLPIFIGER